MHCVVILTHLNREYSKATHHCQNICLTVVHVIYTRLVVPLLTYLLAKKELTLEEVYNVARDLLGAGVDTVSTS